MPISSSNSRGRSRIARDLAQLGLRPHQALDVFSGLGQQDLEDGLSGLLMQAVLGGAVDAAGERLVEKCHAHTLCTADVPQSGRGPGLPLTISANSGQPHRDDLAVLGEPRHRLLQGTFAARVESSDVFLGQGSVGAAEGCKNPARMRQVEEVDGCRVLALDEADL